MGPPTKCCWAGLRATADSRTPRGLRGPRGARKSWGSAAVGLLGVGGGVLVHEGLQGFAADGAAELAVAEGVGGVGLVAGPVGEGEVLAVGPGLAFVGLEGGGDELAEGRRGELGLGDLLDLVDLLLGERVEVPEDRVAVLQVVDQGGDRRAVGERVELLPERRPGLVVRAGE